MTTMNTSTSYSSPSSKSKIRPSSIYLSPSLTNRLRSPRGSPANPRNQRQRQFFSSVTLPVLYSKYYRAVLFVCLPTILVLQWNFHFNGSDGSEHTFLNAPALSQPPSNNVFGLPVVISSGSNSINSHIFSSKNSPEDNVLKKSIQQQTATRTAAAAIPREIYKPNASHPLQVIVVGTNASMNATTATATSLLISEGLSLSRYARIIERITYNPGTRTFVAEKVHDGDDRNKKNEKTPPNNNSSPTTTVYIIDWVALQRDCHVLQRILLPSIHGNGVGDSFLIYIDMSATASSVETCPSIEQQQSSSLPSLLFPPDRIRMVKRSVIRDRYWNGTRNWVEKGHSSIESPATVPAMLIHAPLFLRQDFVRRIDGGVVQGSAVLPPNSTMINKKTKTSKKDLTLFHHRKRPTDIAHFWRRDDYAHFSFLRREVSSVVYDMDRTRISSQSRGSDKDHRLRCVVKWEDDSERYIQQLLSTKIVVVAQRDEWEDHDRLMESLASGAMVMTDVMLAPPAGLKNRTNCIMYDSADSLRSLLRYYLHPKNEKKRLSIARKGRELVHKHHRSWHRIEEILFGAASHR